jgi:hypothetical protein
VSGVVLTQQQALRLAVDIFARLLDPDPGNRTSFGDDRDRSGTARR